MRRHQSLARHLFPIPMKTIEPIESGFHAEIEATNLCNTRCLHCPHETMSRPRGRMNWPTFETVVAKIRGHFPDQRFSLSFSGMGEPLLNPLLPRFIQHVAADARTSFACNGALLTEENVRKLRDAGLDMIYLSFNGDEPAVFSEMMGGLPFDRIRRHLQRAVQLTEGSRLEIRANVSVTKKTRPRVSSIKRLLHDEGVKTVTFSLAHSRGGNLRDPEVVDTPISPPDLVHCAVIAHTLFLDWRGRAFICDHDLHGEHGLGDLMTEPLADVLTRRQRLIDEGVSFKICRECNDVLKGGFQLFRRNVGGILSDWIHTLHADEPAAAFSEATPAQRWLLQIYQKENRLDRAVNRLLAIEKRLQRQLDEEETNREAIRDFLEREVANRDARIAELERENAALRASRAWRWGSALVGVEELVSRAADGERIERGWRLGRANKPADELAEVAPVAVI